MVLRITGPYSLFGPYETALLGILASSSAWASRARECKDAAMGRPFYCFGARHIHPAVAPVMEKLQLLAEQMVPLVYSGQSLWALNLLALFLILWS